MDKKDRMICAFLFLVFLGAGLIAALKLNIPPVLDEVGILANSAYVSGYDWTQTTYTMGGFYYKYGMSLLYAPFVGLIDDPYVLYKALLSVNVILYSMIPVFAYSILRKHLKKERIYSAVFSSAATIIPCCFIFQLYSKADSMLIFLPWLILYIVLELNACEAGRKKKKAFLSFALALSSIYAYAVHTRGLVIIIALVLTLVLAGILIGKSLVNIPVYLGSSAVFLIIDRILVKVFYDGVYGFYGTEHASAESFEFDFLKNIFTSDGIKTVSRLSTGWLFTGLTATCGIIGIAVFGGIVYFIKEYRGFFRNIKLKKAGTAADTINKEQDILKEADKETVTDSGTKGAERIFSIYSVLSLLGVFAMGLLFFFPVVHRYYTEEAIMRSDRLIYERYIAAAFGPAVLYGLFLLVDGAKSVGKKTMLIIRIVTGVFYAGIMTYFFLGCVRYIEGVKGCARYFIGLSTFLNVEYGTTNDAFPDIAQSFLLSGILGIGICIVITTASFFLKKRTVRIVAAGLPVLVVSIIVTIVSYDKIRLSRDSVLVEWTCEPASYLMELPKISRNYPIFWDVSAKDIKHYQFQLKDYRIGSYCTKASKAENCFVIAQKGHFLKEYYDGDYYVFDDFDYENATRDMVYIKGKKLANVMIKAGISVSEYKGKLKKAKLPVQQIMPYKNPAEG